MSFNIGDWRAHRACKDVDTAVFFPQNRTGVVAARKICAECPVRWECLNYAVCNQIQYGIWGGTSENQRANLIRAMRMLVGRDDEDFLPKTQ